MEEIKNLISHQNEKELIQAAINNFDFLKQFQMNSYKGVFLTEKARYENLLDTKSFLLKLIMCMSGTKIEFICKGPFVRDVVRECIVCHLDFELLEVILERILTSENVKCVLRLCTYRIHSTISSVEKCHRESCNLKIVSRFLPHIQRVMLPGNCFSECLSIYLKGKESIFVRKRAFQICCKWENLTPNVKLAHRKIVDKIVKNSRVEKVFKGYIQSYDIPKELIEEIFSFLNLDLNQFAQ